MISTGEEKMKAVDKKSNFDLYQRIFSCVMWHFLGRIAHEVRGICLGFDGETIILRVIFSREPTESEIETLEEIETELISDHIYQSDLQIIVVPTPEPIDSQATNWGWVYIRCED